jgi:hypothetical protein
LGTYIMRATTTGVSNIQLFLDGTGAILAMPDNSTWTFDMLMTCRSTDDTTIDPSTKVDSGFRITGIAFSDGGVSTLLGVTITTLATDIVGYHIPSVTSGPVSSLLIRVNSPLAGVNSQHYYVNVVTTTEIIATRPTPL